MEPKKECAEYCGTTVNKGQAPSLHFSAEDAALPFLTANPKMWQFFEPDLERRLSEMDESTTVTDRTRAALLELLPGGSASIDAVSRKLGKSSRMLQRRLNQEGESFQALLNRTREQLARRMQK